MAKIPERRYNERLTIPPQFNDPGPADQQVRLVDLSPEGACIEHLRSLPEWDICFFALPRALGGIRLQGQVVWSRAVGRQPDTQGGRQIYYQSGLRFTELTPEQRAGLTAALESLRSAQGASPPARPAGEAPRASGETAKGRE